MKAKELINLIVVGSFLIGVLSLALNELIEYKVTHETELTDLCNGCNACNSNE